MTATPQSWAEFLDRSHARPGDLAPDRRTSSRSTRCREICGSKRSGATATDELVAPGELALADTTAEEVVRHEYGHHIALHRLNTPWEAIDWGPEAVGERGRTSARASRAASAFPGDEGPNYTRNPGEAWAETYRLVDERDSGITTATWPIISQSFYPTDAMLQAAETGRRAAVGEAAHDGVHARVREEDGEGLVDSALDSVSTAISE